MGHPEEVDIIVAGGGPAGAFPSIFVIHRTQPSL
jgi:hypothetical protein